MASRSRKWFNVRLVYNFQEYYYPEKYLSILTSKTHRRQFIQFRLRLLDLVINEEKKCSLKDRKGHDHYVIKL